MSTKSKFKGRVECTKAQYEALTEKDPDKEYLITDDDTFARTDSENSFEGRNTFNAETEFNEVVEHGADVKITNSVLKVIDNTLTEENKQKDIVTQYSADEIKIEENENSYILTLPKKSGTLATLEDVNMQSDDSVVLYTEQTLTSDQQTQVCSNLDLENKFVKAQTANSGELKVYCISGSNSHDVCLVTNVGKANCVARYATSGQLKSTVDPVDDTDLVRLNYIKNKLNHAQVYFGTTLPSSGIGTTYLENDVFILSNSNGTKNFYQLNYIDNSSSLSWHDMVDFEKPKWQVFAPSDTSQVLMTEVTIITSDEINFTGMDGKKVTINGYSADGFSAGTVVCDELDSDMPYSPAFIGSMTSTRASGVFVKGGSVTIVNVDNPEVTFSYKYLW